MLVTVEGMAINCPRCSQRGQGYAAIFTDWLILRYQWGVSVYIISVNGMAVMCNLGNFYLFWSIFMIEHWLHG